MSNSYQTQGYTLNNAGRRLVVDPITRIEGHMRCEVNIDEQNIITNAVSCGTMFRGLEIILQGRDPRDAWAFVERICGVCTGVHALASVYAIEDAIGIGAPVFNYKENLVGAIGVVIPKERVTEATKKEYIEAVKNCGIEFSKNLGYSEV